MPSEPVVVNLNVPDLPLDKIAEWRFAEVGTMPPRALAGARLEPVSGHEEAYEVKMEWGDVNELDPLTDGGTVEADVVAVTYLSRMVHEPRPDVDPAVARLSDLLSP
jgi:5'-nucleotidase